MGSNRLFVRRPSCAVLVTLAATPTLPAQIADLTDPAPPVVRELEASEAPRPKEFPEGTTHAAPRALPEDANTEDWPAFLGARRDGHSRETHLAKSWPEGGPTLLWEMQRGDGYACPVVAQGRVVLAHRVGDATHVDCLEAETGRRYWRFSYPMEFRPRYITDAGPRATPVIAEGRVVVHGVEGQLHCLELTTGRVIWKRDLKAEFGVPDGFFGVVASPIVYEDRLFVLLGAPGGPTVIALDPATGRLMWGAGEQWGADCASPVIAKVHGRTRLFALTGGESRPPSGGLMVLDPASGAIDFTHPFRSRTFESVNGASPLVFEDRVFLTAAYNTGSAVLQLEKDGGYSELWASKRIGIEFSNPLFVEGHLYLVDGVHDRAGAIVCLDPASGEELARTDLNWDESVLWKGEERELSMSIGAGSMIWADGDFLCLGDNGHLLWLRCSPKGAEVLARASLFGANRTWTPPVLSRGLLYVCQTTPERFGERPARLLCYDLRAEK